MPPIVLNEDDIERLLPNIDVKEALRGMFSELASQRAVQPSQSVTLFPNGQGDFITYQGVLEKHGVFGAKLSPYIGNNGEAFVTAWTCLMSMKTGQPLLLCDSAKLTTERTGATTALAVDLLSKSDSKVLTIIGSGAIALAHWRHVESLRDWGEVRVWSPNLSTNSKRRQQWSSAVPSIRFAESAEFASSGADVILLCTSSGTSVIDDSVISDGTLVTSISTNVPGAHEVQPQFLNRAQVYCDYRKTTPETAGEMVSANRDHGWSADDIVGDLAELVVEQCAKPDGKSAIFFRSLGLGLEDIAIANEIYTAYQQAEGLA